MTTISRALLIAVVLSGVSAARAHGDIITFSGRDLDGSLVNSREALSRFAARVSDLATEDFESLTSSTMAPVLLPGFTIPDPGPLFSFGVLDGTGGAEDFPVSGTKHIAITGAAAGVVFDEVRFVFDSPVSAFGFFATDLDFEDVFVRFANPAAHEFIIPRVESDISSIFFGFIDTSGATSEVIVGDNGLLVTYDDVSFGRTLVPVPEPSCWMLLGLGLLGLFPMRKAASAG